jgi:hypothetical protein
MRSCIRHASLIRESNDPKRPHQRPHLRPYLISNLILYLIPYSRPHERPECMINISPGRRKEEKRKERME